MNYGMRLCASLLIVSLVSLSASSARSELLDGTFSFSATFDPDAPINELLTVSAIFFLDTSIDVENIPITSYTTNLLHVVRFDYSYDPSRQSLLFNLTNITPAYDDLLILANFSFDGGPATTPTSMMVTYNVGSFDGLADKITYSFTPKADALPVPEPGTRALLGSAFIGLVFLWHRHRVKSASVGRISEA